MIGATRVANPVRERKIKKALKRNQKKYNALFLKDTTITKQLTEHELMNLLIAGEGTYWDLEYSDEGEILGIKPYSLDVVLKNLHPTVDDVFADFTARL